MPKVKMSDFIHWIVFKTPDGAESDVDNTRGDILIDYVDLSPVFGTWASIKPLVGREVLVARQMRGDLTHKIACHFDARITHRLRFEWNSRKFNVGPPVADSERPIFHEFYAGEIIG
jgi:SPP1 family predicted phage head-tail adaptor